ncbi:MAG: nucleotidyl transferase AbiEii/AbiGii toxin family protein, partial [Spirochaetes bacterium]|nr:nucleotidyl transferase AbiEii/AbiGii toxin family protein [Spirochaetota bacterium]
ARQKGEEFELFLVRFASERFLYRLGISQFRERCILKGAGLLTIWMADPYRSTRDLDFLAFGPDDEKGIREIITTVCNQPCPEDGLRFDLGSLTVEPIREEQEYHGQRAAINAYLGSARIRVKIDFGFGDAVVPAPQDMEYPTLLPGLPAPRVRVYPLSLSVAEKFEAMVKYGAVNSLMKDFHDVSSSGPTTVS